MQMHSRRRWDRAPRARRCTPISAWPGWGVLAAPGAPGAGAVEQPAASRRLRALVVALLARLSGGFELPQAGALVVDDRLGQEIARTPHELLESAIRLGASRISYEGE